MVFETFKKKSFKDKLKNTGFLIKNSFTIIGKDKDIKVPTIRMIILSTIITFFIYSAILTFVLGKFVGIGILLAVVALFILIPFSFFYNVRQKANQSWIVYNTICGKNISYTDAHNHTKSEKGKLRIIAFIDILMKYANSQKGNKKGVIGFLIAVFLSFLSEIWDLLSHYMLPAIVIEQKSLKEIVPQIKALRNNVPATLVGVFGIDFVGTVIGSLFGLIVLIAILISIGLGYIIAIFTNITVLDLGFFSFSWVPTFAILFLVSIIGGAYAKIVESIKVIYFTVFYTSIMRPMNISEGMKEELTNYLLMDESDFSAKQPSPHEQYIKQLSTYIKQYEDNGYSRQEIKNFLISKNVSEADINFAINIRK